MHAFAVLSLLASTALVAAQQEEYAEFSPLTTFGTLQARQQQSCASVGGKACGSKCIQISYTCCGNGQGACEVGYVCGIAANGIYGCCPIGKRCRGDAPEPSSTILGGSRPTSSADDDDEPTSEAPTTRATSTTTRRLTPASTTSTPARTTAPVSGGDDESSSSSSSAAVATGGSGNTGSGSNGNGSGSNGNGGTTTTAVSGGGSGSGSASSAGMVTVGLASLAGGFIAAIAALL